MECVVYPDMPYAHLSASVRACRELQLSDWETGPDSASSKANKNDLCNVTEHTIRTELPLGRLVALC